MLFEKSLKLYCQLVRLLHVPGKKEDEQINIIITPLNIKSCVNKLIKDYFVADLSAKGISADLIEAIHEVLLMNLSQLQEGLQANGNA